ncbi:hypothetical protein [Cytobacillus solani]|uniref:Uncharacterized protein n=1 Tax=Cytobacillus solani TaxID=1637975 RepID=A0A0Q3QM06_9BACI|nr:hypothetical protein [Cytobacillus solani]KQL19097.1 hypothetical protein AN957_11230 [Cytobacillus solani]
MKKLYNFPSSINWLIFTLVFTIILLSIFDISIITIAGFISGVILAIVNLYNEEFRKERNQ